MKTQIGICYICNEPIYDTDKNYSRIGIEIKHTSSKCAKESMRRTVNDLPTRHPDYIKPIPVPEAPKVVPVVVVPKLNTTCPFCKVEMILVVDYYECPKCRQTATEIELRKGGTDGTSNVSGEVQGNTEQPIT